MRPMPPRRPYEATRPADRTLRVWSNGRDVTDDDPRSWPWPYSDWYAQGWRPVDGPNRDGALPGGLPPAGLHGTHDFTG